MVLENYSYSIGSVPSQEIITNNYSFVSDITGIETYDQKIGSYRPIKESEIPVDDNNYIIISKEGLINDQTKIQLQCKITDGMYPEDKTIIIYGKVKSVPTNGYVIASQQSIPFQYEWKLLLFSDKIEFRRNSYSDFSADTYNTSKDQYYSITYNNSLIIGDELLLILRFDEIDYTITINGIVNGTPITEQSLIFGENMSMLTNGCIQFYDVDNLFENDFLLKGCIYIDEKVSDSDVSSILSDPSEITTLYEQNNDTFLSNSERIKRKTVSLELTDINKEIISNNDIPDNKRIYIHSAQLRINGLVPGDNYPLVHHILQDNNTIPVVFAYFYGVDLGSGNVVPPEGYWTLNTPNINGLNNPAPGFLETGGTLGKGVTLHSPLGFLNTGYITIYYTIEE